MLPRFHWSDITTVGHYLGVLIFLTGLAMGIPALVALVFGETRQLVSFVVGIGFCLTIGSLLRLLESHELDRRRSLLLVGFSWLVVGYMASIPLCLSGALDSWFDALFDSVSALTTTGVTLADDIDALGYAQTTWRVILSFAGAQTVVVIAMYSGFFGEGSRVFVMSDRRDGERTRPRISETLRLVVRVSGIFALVGTVAVTIVCLMLGLNPIDAFMNGLWLAMCAVSTSGFVPHTSDLIYYHSLPLQLVLCVLMLAGSISFGIFFCLQSKRYKRVLNNSELRVYMVWIALLVIFVVYAMMRDGIITTAGGLLQNGMVTAVSAATTCGMQTVYPDQIGGTVGDGAIILICIAILFGTCAYSSGGGIKIIRILQVFRWIGYSIMLRLAPESAHIRINYEHFGPRTLSSKDATLAMTVFIMFIATAALGSMAFIAHGNDALNSVLEVLSYVTNCGITTTITQDGLPLDLKVVALLLMWAGRIEFIALIAAIVGIIMSLQPSNLFSNARSRALRERKDTNRGGTAWRRRKGQRSGHDANTGVTSILVLTLFVAGIGIPAAYGATETVGEAQVLAQGENASNNAETYRLADVKSLLSATARQDQHKVEVEGEAVGSSIYADSGHKWVNIKKDNAMIGVYMANEDAAKITNWASYGHAGDTLSVKGVYHLACAEHNGELEVHADSVDVVQTGSSWHISWDAAMLAWGILLIIVGIVVTLLRRVFRGTTRSGFFSI